MNLNENGERRVLGPNLIKEAKEQVHVVREKIKKTQSHQKSYADRRRHELMFEVGDHIYLKVSPMKGTHHFGMKGKLAPPYVGPFKILEERGPIVYQLDLPPLLLDVYDVFHIS